MAFFPSNRTSDPNEEECPLLEHGTVWRKSYLTDDTRRNLIALTSITSILVLPTILLNALVVIAVATRQRLRTPSNILLTSMAGTDLFTGLIVQPIIIAVYVRRILSDSPFCILKTVFLQLALASGVTSFSHLVLIGIDRFIAVKKPLRYQSIVTRQRVKIGVILAWAFTFCHRIPEFSLFVIDNKEEMIFYKKIQRVMSSILGTLYTVVIAYMYAYIYSESRRQKKRLKNEQLTQEEARKVRKDNNHPGCDTFDLCTFNNMDGSNSFFGLHVRTAFYGHCMGLDKYFHHVRFSFQSSDLLLAFEELPPRLPRDVTFKRATKPPTGNRNSCNTTTLA